MASTNTLTKSYSLHTNIHSLGDAAFLQFSFQSVKCWSWWKNTISVK